MSAGKADIDVVIVNYFSAGDVRHSLERLQPWPFGTIWLVDNSADAAELAALRACTAHLPHVNVIDPGVNLGFGRGCNLAFEKSTAPLVVLLNPDAQVSIADLSLLAQALEDDPRLAAVSPRIYWDKSRGFLLPVAFPQTPRMAVAQALAPRAQGLAKWAAARYIRNQRQRMASGSAFAVDFVAGAVLMLRREAVLAAGGLFDPDYFMFYEDSDLSLRLRRAGHGLAMVPAAAAVHEYRHKAFKAGLMAQSRDQYYRKRYPRFHRVSNGLSRVEALSRPLPLERWYTLLPKPCRTLADFIAQAGSAGVVAFSPSMLMMPAIFRPQDAPIRGFSEEEWALLEPATYVALMQDAGEPEGHWVHFERAR